MAEKAGTAASTPARMCRCEHADHWPVTPGHFASGEKPRTVPRAHAYGAFGPDVQPIRTDYGTFECCAECRAAGHCPAAEARRGGNRRMIEGTSADRAGARGHASQTGQRLRGHTRRKRDRDARGSL